jgi:hypothetical protein
MTVVNRCIDSEPTCPRAGVTLCVSVDGQTNWSEVGREVDIGKLLLNKQSGVNDAVHEVFQWCTSL